MSLHKLMFSAAVLTILAATTSAAKADYYGTVDEITEKTITLNGVKYGLGGGNGLVHIWAQGRQGGNPDRDVQPARVRKFVKVGDQITGRDVFAGDGSGRNNVWYIFIK